MARRNTGGRGRGIALIFFLISLVSAICSVIMIYLFISMLSNTVVEPIEDCTKKCHPYAPELRYNECFCDRESIRP